MEVNPWPIIIDEIQKVPALLDAIKIKIDEQRKIWLKNNEERKLMYVLTGSNRFELQQGISETLAGRCGIIEMSSFTLREKKAMEAHLFTPKIEVLIQRSQQEKSEYLTRTQIFEEIYKGGMPDICTNVSERNIYYKSYVNTYIEKDVRKLIAASNETQFRNFISIVALRTAQELHYDEIAGAVGIDVKTCKRWLSILETSGIIYLLQPYMSNMSNRIIKAPKLYFMDTGLCAYLCKWPDSKMLENCAMSGAFFETYVVSELIKNFFSFNVNPRDYLYYYRDIDQKEIDKINNWSSISYYNKKNISAFVNTINTNEEISNSISKIYLNSNDTSNEFDLSVSGQFLNNNASPKFNSFENKSSLNNLPKKNLLNEGSLCEYNSNNTKNNDNKSNCINILEYSLGDISNEKEQNLNPIDSFADIKPPIENNISVGNINSTEK